MLNRISEDRVRQRMEDKNEFGTKVSIKYSMYKDGCTCLIQVTNFIRSFVQPKQIKKNEHLWCLCSM